MTDADNELHHFDRRMVWAGFRQLAPISIFVTLFGAAFGLAAVQTGLDDSVILAMSALVFAGASQFAALELWGPQVPLFTLMVTVFAINARHLLMGATLCPWLRQLPPGRRYGVMLIASDANWAMAMQAFNRNRPGFGLLLGGVLAHAYGFALVFWIAVAVKAVSLVAMLRMREPRAAAGDAAGMSSDPG